MEKLLLIAIPDTDGVEQVVTAGVDDAQQRRHAPR